MWGRYAVGAFQSSQLSSLPAPALTAPAWCACLPALQVWSTKGVEGVHRFLARVYRLVTELPLVDDAPTADQLRLLHQCIKKVCLGGCMGSRGGRQALPAHDAALCCALPAHAAALCCFVLYHNACFHLAINGLNPPLPCR